MSASCSRFIATTKLRSSVVLALVTVAALLAAPSQSRADPCVLAYYTQNCLMDPSAYRVRFSFSSTTPLTNIVDSWAEPGSFLSDQGDFPANSLASLPTGSGVLDAGIWVGDANHYLLALTNIGGTDHLVVMMSPTAAAHAVGNPLEDIINGNPVDPLVQIPVGQAEALIIDRLKNQPEEWETDIDVFLRYTPQYPNRMLPALLITSGGTYDVGGTAADFVMVQYSNGQTIGSVGVEVTPVPEPATWTVLLAGIGLLAMRRRAKPSRSGALPI